MTSVPVCVPVYDGEHTRVFGTWMLQQFGLWCSWSSDTELDGYIVRVVDPDSTEDVMCFIKHSAIREAPNEVMYVMEQLTQAAEEVQRKVRSTWLRAWGSTRGGSCLGPGVALAVCVRVIRCCRTDRRQIRSVTAGNMQRAGSSMSPALPGCALGVTGVGLTHWRSHANSRRTDVYLPQRG